MKPSKEISEIQKNIQQIQVRVNSMYTTMGKIYMEKNQNNPEPEYVAIINEIRNCENTVTELNNRIKLLNGIVTCTNCGADNNSATAFCSVCGTRLPHKINVNDPTKCKNCGSSLVAGRNFCGVCGTPVAAPQAQPEPIPAPQAQPESIPAPQTQPEPAPVVEMENIEEVHTPEVAVTTEPETEAKTETVQEMPVQQVKFCPNCGTKARAEDALFCAECGTRF